MKLLAKFILSLTLLLSFLLFDNSHLSYAANEGNPPPNVLLTEIFTTTRDSKMITNSIVEITPNNQNKAGAIWSTENNLMDLSEDFHAVMHLYLGNKGSNAGDGMAFVMQNDPARQNAYSYSGASLGVWANEKAGDLHGGISNSFAVEFDTYYNNTKNDSRFDDQLFYFDKANHVAYGFPGRPVIRDDWSATYVDWWPSIFEQNQRTLMHESIQLPGNLSNDNWHRFEINWSTATQSLTYRFKDLPEVIVPIDVTDTFGNSKVIWGFTGSTGTKSQTNRVVFESVPGLVNATVETYATRADNIPLESGSIVNFGEELDFYLDATYLSGKQKWLDVQASFNLNPLLKRIPGTTKLINTSTGEELLLDDSVWLGNYFLADLGNLNQSESNKKLTFKVVPNATTEGIHPVTHSVYYPSPNHIMTAPDYTLQLDSNQAPEITLTEPDSTVFLDNLDNQIQGTWLDLNDGAMVINYELNGQPYLQESLNSSHDNQWKLNFPKESLTVGPNQLIVYGVDAHGASSAKVKLDFTVVSPPKMTLADNSLNQEVLFSDPYSIKGSWSDKDSPLVSLYQVVNGGPEELLVSDLSNDTSLGSTVSLTKELQSTSLNMGENALIFFLKDQDGYLSNKITITVTVSGSLDFTLISPEASFEDMSIPNGISYSKRKDNWAIKVRDTRNTNSSWRIQAVLKETSIPTGQHSLEQRLIYRDHNNQDRPFEFGVPLDVFSHQTVTTEAVAVTWKDNQGILFKGDSSL